uniref:C2H2-type domain-containing protein n=1 Tax=Oncorhynchus tshawytscha TaxID=74940 RepID=A0A8C8FSQ0_ONCTS
MTSPKTWHAIPRSCPYSPYSERLMTPQVNPLTGATFSLPSIGSINWNMDPVTTQTLPGLRPPHTLLLLNQTSDNASASALNGNTSPLTNDSRSDVISRSGGKEKRGYPPEDAHRVENLSAATCEKMIFHQHQLKMHQKVHKGERPLHV